MSYESLYNIIDGILIVQQNIKGTQDNGSPGDPGQGSSPSPLTELQLPDLSHWAELTYYVWNHLRGGADNHRSTTEKFCTLHDQQEDSRFCPLEKFWPYGDGQGPKDRLATKSSLYLRTDQLNYVIVPDIGPGTLNLLKVIRECLWSRNMRQIPTMENREKFGVGHW